VAETQVYAPVLVRSRLLRAFDEIEAMKEHGRRLVVDGENIEELLEPLGIG